jgi:hypothetical protein
MGAGNLRSPASPRRRVIAGIADEACMVLLGRIGRTGHAFAGDALEALRDMDRARAAAIVASIEKIPGRSL